MRRARRAGKWLALAAWLLAAAPAGAQEGTLRVTDFGAACDGATDDAAAINAAIRHGKGNNPDRFHPGFRLAFPAGRTCVIGASLDLTGLWGGMQTAVEGNGATLDCRTAGAPCIDMMGSRYVALRDLTITGHAERTPSFAIQYGRTRPERVADLQEFTRLATLGRFTRAKLYNRAAETVRHTSIRLWGHAPYSLVLDGINHFEVTSAFTDAAFARDTPMSFNEPLFVQADLRNSNPDGSAIWMAKVARPTFVASYIGQAGPVAVVLWTGAGTLEQIDANIHIETAAVQVAFLVAGGNGRSILGLRYTDFESFAQRAVFAMAPGVDRVNLMNLQLELRLRNPAARVFDRPDGFAANGQVLLRNAEAWNAPRSFQGMLCVGMLCSFQGAVTGAGP
jgi:hypothetical protein